MAIPDTATTTKPAHHNLIAVHQDADQSQHQTHSRAPVQHQQHRRRTTKRQRHNPPPTSEIYRPTMSLLIVPTTTAKPVVYVLFDLSPHTSQVNWDKIRETWWSRALLYGATGESKL